MIRLSDIHYYKPLQTLMAWHTNTHTFLPSLDKYTVGNYSLEACHRRAVRTVIARGMVGYREANFIASVTLATTSDFDYKEMSERRRLAPKPFSYLILLNKLPWLNVCDSELTQLWCQEMVVCAPEISFCPFFEGGGLQKLDFDLEEIPIVCVRK